MVGVVDGGVVVVCDCVGIDGVVSVDVHSMRA